MTREFRITSAQYGAAFMAHVIAGADSTAITEIQADGSLIIHLAESTDESRADAHLIAFLAEVLDVRPDQIAIVAGTDAPDKIISVEGVSPGWIEQRLARII